jgi:tetratricopeptide (TPR) repeat protein
MEEGMMTAFARRATIGIFSVIACALPQAASAQGNSLAGTWNFVPDKSTFMPDSMRYKSMTLTIDPGQTKMDAAGVDADGNAVKASYPATADGKSHPISGSPDADAGTLTRFSDTGASFIYTKRKSNVAIGNRILSQDGNVLTFTEKTYDDRGKQTGTARIVFAKPGYDFASANTNTSTRGPTMGSPLSPEEMAATALLEKGDDDAAIAAFTKLIDGKPTPMLYYDHVSRGIAYAKKMQNDLALADFDASLKLKPDNTDARFRRGGTRLQLKQYDAAIEDLNAVIQADTSNAMAYRLRGFAYNTQGKDKLAGADYDKACSLNKDLCQN